MNTAKNLQLLDAQSNNISPATNIESLYYEINQGGAVYRNAIYKHFPVYVKYNNNVDYPYSVGVNYMATPPKQTQQQLKMESYDTSLATLVDNGTDGDILVSSIKQSRLSGTRYYKLDVTTYDLSNILQQFPSKKWVVDTFNRHDTSIHNITYESTVYRNNNAAQYISMPYSVGGYDAGVMLGTLDGRRVNDILDNILFPDASPAVSQVNVGWEYGMTGQTMEFLHICDHDFQVETQDAEGNDVKGFTDNAGYALLDYKYKSIGGNVTSYIMHEGGSVSSFYVSAVGIPETTTDVSAYVTCVQSYRRGDAFDDFFIGGSDSVYNSVYKINVILGMYAKDTKNLHTLRGNRVPKPVNVLKTANVCVGGLFRTAEQCVDMYPSEYIDSATKAEIHIGDLYYRVRHIIPVVSYICPDTGSFMTKTNSLFQCFNYLKQWDQPSDVCYDYIRDYGVNTLEFWYTPTHDTYFMIPAISNYIAFSDIHVSQISGGIGWSGCNYEITNTGQSITMQVDFNASSTGIATYAAAQQYKYNIYKFSSKRSLNDFGSGVSTYAATQKPYSKIRVSITVSKK